MAALLFGTMIDNNGDGRINDEVRNAIETSAMPATSLATVHGESISPELYRSLWERLNDLSGLTSQLDILHGSLLTPARKTRPT